jgi:hypothetical protein
MTTVADAEHVAVAEQVDEHLDELDGDELDGERSLRERDLDDAAFGDHVDLHMHDVARYGISGFTGLGLAWGTLAVVVATIGAPVGAAPSLVLLAVWLTVWIGSAALVNAVLGRVQQRSLGAVQKQLSSSSSSSSNTGGTSIAVPGMRP